MLKVALRGVFARKLRAFLTALAVFLGVALMTGTYVLTDTFTNSFGQFSQYLYGGLKWRPIAEHQPFYVKLSAGVLHGYSGE